MSSPVVYGQSTALANARSLERQLRTRLILPVMGDPSASLVSHNAKHPLRRTGNCKRTRCWTAAEVRAEGWKHRRLTGWLSRRTSLLLRAACPLCGKVRGGLTADSVGAPCGLSCPVRERPTVVLPICESKARPHAIASSPNIILESPSRCQTSHREFGRVVAHNARLILPSRQAMGA